MFFVADWQTVLCAGLTGDIQNIRPVSTLTGGRLAIAQSILLDSLLIAYKEERSHPSTLLVSSTSPVVS